MKAVAHEQATRLLPAENGADSLFVVSRDEAQERAVIGKDRGTVEIERRSAYGLERRKIRAADRHPPCFRGFSRSDFSHKIRRSPRRPRPRRPSKPPSPTTPTFPMCHPLRSSLLFFSVALAASWNCRTCLAASPNFTRNITDVHGRVIQELLA
ncbi:MAG: hypothetical protein JNK23_20845 [Opitutaceae bacterium]|nr:hypothetical protein [Opitutaceae bacterium]